jgi:Tol biopolymer transport system component
MKNWWILGVAIVVMTGCSTSNNSNDNTTSKKEDGYSGATQTDKIQYEGETHLNNIKQLTFGGDNAEAYWSFDDQMLVFQATNPAWGVECDQIYVTRWKDADLKNKPAQMMSTGWGRTTCSYFLPGDSTIVYASTHLVDTNCPPKPEKRADGKYVWPIYPSFDIFVADLGGRIIDTLTTEPGYDAEATVSPKGDKIVFTSLRTGDLELFTMNIDGSDVKQITNELGYDGGAFFSPDGTKLIFRSSRPKTKEDIEEYKSLLADGLVTPTEMELYMCDVDGSNLKQLTTLGKANWCPFFHPDGDKVLFASNHATEKGFPFNLYMIDTTGQNLEQITYDKVFDAFPVFSNNGKHLVFSSNRNNGGTHETNLFIADWVE